MLLAYRVLSLHMNRESIPEHSEYIQKYLLAQFSQPIQRVKNNERTNTNIGERYKQYTTQQQFTTLEP